MNVDGLHQKAGSENVIEIHGNAFKDNIVLYGQSLLNSDEAVELILKTAHKAKEVKEKGYLLVIGTSMETNFANVLVHLAQKQGLKVVYMNKDADCEVEEFFRGISNAS